MDGVNLTTNDSHMWMVAYTKGSDHWVTVDFGEKVKLSALRFHNYNKRVEDTQRGAKFVAITFDGVPLTPPAGVVLRQAPGRCAYDFGQTVQLATAVEVRDGSNSPGTDRGAGAGAGADAGAGAGVARASSSIRANSVQSAPAAPSNATAQHNRPTAAQRKTLETVMPFYIGSYEPSGMLLTVNVLSTWGDLYYVGLNGMQVRTPSGLTAFPACINAIPSDVNVLLNESDAPDPRVVANLLDGRNTRCDDDHVWLTPFVPGTPVTISLSYDEPVTLGALRLWNYSKSARRGVRQFQVLLDGRLIFEGELAASPSADASEFQSVLFSGNAGAVERERGHMIQPPAEVPGGSIRLEDNGRVLEDPLAAANGSGGWSVGDRPKTAAARE